jgi:hypothetical protein
MGCREASPNADVRTAASPFEYENLNDRREIQQRDGAENNLFADHYALPLQSLQSG